MRSLVLTLLTVVALSACSGGEHGDSSSDEPSSSDGVAVALDDFELTAEELDAELLALGFDSQSAGMIAGGTDRTCDSESAPEFAADIAMQAGVGMPVQLTGLLVRNGCIEKADIAAEGADIYNGLLADSSALCARSLVDLSNPGDRSLWGLFTIQGVVGV